MRQYFGTKITFIFLNFKIDSNFVAKITDFGISTIKGNDQRMTQVVGTPWYMVRVYTCISLKQRPPKFAWANFMMRNATFLAFPLSCSNYWLIH